MLITGAGILFEREILQGCLSQFSQNIEQDIIGTVLCCISLEDVSET